MFIKKVEKMAYRKNVCTDYSLSYLLDFDLLNSGCKIFCCLKMWGKKSVFEILGIVKLDQKKVKDDGRFCVWVCVWVDGCVHVNACVCSHVCSVPVHDCIPIRLNDVICKSSDFSLSFIIQGPKDRRNFSFCYYIKYLWYKCYWYLLCTF